ncbi:MAG: hypothetical protein RI967_2214 [Planctomycetota bacterium]
MRKDEKNPREQSIPTPLTDRNARAESTTPTIVGGRTGVAGWTPFELESLLVEAIARELGRRFGGNAVLDRLEAAALLARHVAFETESRDRRVRRSRREATHPPTLTPPPVEQDSRR